MTDIEQALAELELATNLWRAHHLDHKGVHGSQFNRMCLAIDNLAALRAKKARENALYAPQWKKEDGGLTAPHMVVHLQSVKNLMGATLYGLEALHPFDKEEGKYTGEVITGEALTDLLNGER